MLNPAYKRLIINGAANAKRRLIIPKVDQKKYPALYNVLNGLPDPVLSQPLPTVAALSIPVPAPQPTYVPATYVAARPAAVTPSANPEYYVIKSGETLEQVAAHHGVNVRDLRAWNNIPDGQATVGQKIILNPVAKITKL
jgi:hypothetical protein